MNLNGHETFVQICTGQCRICGKQIQKGIGHESGGHGPDGSIDYCMYCGEDMAGL